MHVVLLCHGSLLYSYAHVSLVFIKTFWEKLFSTGVVETGIERLIVAIFKGGEILSRAGECPPPPLNAPLIVSLILLYMYHTSKYLWFKSKGQ